MQRCSLYVPPVSCGKSQSPKPIFEHWCRSLNITPFVLIPIGRSSTYIDSDTLVRDLQYEETVPTSESWYILFARSRVAGLVSSTGCNCGCDLRSYDCHEMQIYTRKSARIE